MRTAYSAATVRHYPLRDTAASYTAWLGLVGSAVLALVGYGVLTVVQGDAIVGLLGIIPGLVNGVATTLTATGITRSVEPRVTPVADPHDNDGHRLVRADTTGPAQRSSLFGVPGATTAPRRRPADTAPAGRARRDDHHDDEVGNPLSVVDPSRGSLYGAGLYASGAGSDNNTGTGDAGGGGGDCRDDTSTGNHGGDTTSHGGQSSGGYSGGYSGGGDTTSYGGGGDSGGCGGGGE